jgi:hypothetical protein
MSKSLLEELLDLEGSIAGKNDENIQAIEEIQKNRNLSLKDDLVCETAKARSYLFSGSIGVANRIVNLLKIFRLTLLFGRN